MQKITYFLISSILCIAFQNCGEFSSLSEQGAHSMLSENGELETLTNEEEEHDETSLNQDKIQIPIDIIPETLDEMVDGFSLSRSICLESRLQTNNFFLELSIHRPGYRRIKVGENFLWEEQAKLSVAIAKENKQPAPGQWIEIKNDNPKVQQSASTIRAGGLSGSEKSATLSIQFNTDSIASSGENEDCFWLHIRFNGTEGITSGTSIYDIALKDDKGDNVSIAKTQTTVQGRSLTTDGDITLGQKLFNRQDILYEDPISRRAIKSSCLNCHAEGGRDIHFYGFSDQSIISRGVFHGLNQHQANSIKEYIRDYNKSRNLKAMGRPWNPPFQPGFKHLQAKLSDQELADRWNAGAGIQAVSSADHSPQILDTVFGVDDISLLTSSHIKNLFEGKRLNEAFPNGTLDYNSVPVTIQFPDWNEWLPLVSPHDLFVEADGEDLFVKTKLYQHYIYLKDNLKNLQNNPQQLLNQLTEFHRRTSRLFGVWRDHRSVNPNHPKGCTGEVGSSKGPTCNLQENADKTLDLMARAFANGYSREMTRRATVAWTNVKLWELIRTHSLETFGHQKISNKWNRVSWPSNYMSVFAYAPHIVSNNISYFEHNPIEDYGKDNPSIIGQSENQGKFESNQWYQLQLALNTGNFQEIDHRPNDWPYTFTHIASSVRLSDSTEESIRGTTTPSLTQSLRFIIIFAIANHMRQKTRTDLFGYTMRYMTPMWTIAGHWKARIFSNGRLQLRDEHLQNLNRLKPGLHKAFVSAYLTHFLNQAEDISKQDIWLRCNDPKVKAANGSSQWYCLPEYNPNLHKRNLQADTKFLFDTIEWANKMDHLQIHLNTQHFIKEMNLNKNLMNRYDRWLLDNFPGLPPDQP